MTDSSAELTLEEHRDIATKLVKRLQKARGELHFAAGEAEKLGEHGIANDIDAVKGNIDEIFQGHFEEVEE